MGQLVSIKNMAIVLKKIFSNKNDRKHGAKSIKINVTALVPKKKR